jgi:hypothetical protein
MTLPCVNLVNPDLASDLSIFPDRFWIDEECNCHPKSDDEDRRDLIMELDAGGDEQR